MHACDTIIFDYDVLNEDEIPIQFCVQDTYPSLPNLSRTAEQGCSFCRLLIDRIVKVFIDRHIALPVDVKIMGRLLTQSALLPGLEEEVTGVYQLSLDIMYGEAEKVPLYFSIHAAEDTVAASVGRIRRRPLHEDVTSDAAIELMNKWIRECQTDHDSCKSRKDSELPTRVLDVSTEDLGIDCRLVQSQSTRSRHAPYIALSHCWGSPNASVPMTTTTSVTLSQRMQAIILKSLPQNFRDAIAVTRLLGIRYLWIDSLCIIQDSREDWNREGGRMGQIYEGAYLTVAATGASNADDGFLSRAPSIYATIPFRSPAIIDQTARVLLMPSNSASWTLEEDIDLSLWDGRAWTLQERYLSTRMLHFCKDRFYFECRSGSRSEHNEPEVIARFPSIFDDDATSDETISSIAADDDYHNADNNDQDAKSDAQALGVSDVADKSADEDNEILEVDYSFELFYRLIGQYSPRKLTFAADKLPALAGIAHKVHMQSGSTYLAGLWEDDLAYGLLWRAPDPDETCAVPIYRAPSWSWVCLDGQITWPSYWNVPGCTHNGRPFESAIWIVDAQVQVSSANPYGEVTSAHLILKAKSISVRVSGPSGQKATFEYSLFTTGQTGPRMIGSGALDVANYEVDQKPTYLLQVHEQLPGVCERQSSWSGLILEVVRDDANTSSVFKRIGIYLLAENSLYIFDNVEETELKII